MQNIVDGPGFWTPRNLAIMSWQIRKFTRELTQKEVGNYLDRQGGFFLLSAQEV